MSKDAENKMIELIVYPTIHRENLAGEYLAQLHPKTASLLGNIKKGGYLSIGRRHNDRVIRVHAQFNEFDESLPENGIRIDQTLRAAIGAKEQEKVIIEKLPLPQHGIIKRIAIFLLGKQVEVMRVKKAVYGDMEKKLCRIKKDSMTTIGVEEGDWIEIESVDNSISLRTLELSNEIKRIKEKQTDGNPDVYLNCIDVLRLKRLNKTELDIPWILLDFDARRTLGIETCDAVRVYRDPLHAFYKQVHQLSVPLVLLIIGAILSMEGKIIVKLLLLSFGFSAAVGILLYETRKRIVS